LGCSLRIRLSEDTATLAATLHLGTLARVLANYSVLISTPGVNLVHNIGFGLDATHTTTDGPHQALKMKTPNQVFEMFKLAA
jgi:hypothetical protein